MDEFIYSTGETPKVGDYVQHYVDLDEGTVTAVDPGTAVTVEWINEEGEAEHLASECALLKRPADEPQRFILSRTRPGDGAPSLSLQFTAKDAEGALELFEQRYGAQGLGTRIDVRLRGADRHSRIASYTRFPNVWVVQS